MMMTIDSAIFKIIFRVCLIFLQEAFPGLTASSSMLRIPSCGRNIANHCGRSHRSAPTITFQESPAALPGNYV